MLKSAIEKILPVFLVNRLIKIKQHATLLKNYIYDKKRYSKYSGTIALDSPKKLEARLIASYHVLEKGLSMPDPREGFGKDTALYLIGMLDHYNQKKYDLNSGQYLSAIQVLDCYIDLQKKYNCNMDDVEAGLAKIRNGAKPTQGGSKEVTRNELINQSTANFEKLANSRCSIRNFDNKAVDLDLIKKAIKIAQRTPSVCNRQSARVYIVKDKINVERISKFQNGNRGFRHLIDKLLIVTSDLQVFEGANERYQGFIDGGMFAMSILYALQYLGLGACALNWAVTRERDEELRQNVPIKDSENVIMFIAVGHLPKTLKVAFSKRRDVDQVIEIL